MADEEKKTEDQVQMVIFQIGREEFGAPINQIKEIVMLPGITRMPKAPPFIKGVINLRGRVIAVVDLAKRFDFDAKARDENTRIIVVEVDDNIIGMIVDSVTEVLRLSNENIDMTPPIIESRIKVDFIKGVGKYDGRLFILLDLYKIMAIEETALLEDIKDQPFEEKDTNVSTDR